MQHRMVFFVVAVALILAIAGFLLLSFLTRNDEPVEETPGEQPVGETPGDLPPGIPVFVDDTTVYLQPLAEKAVTLNLPPPVQPTQPEVAPPPEPTQTPEVEQPPVAQPTAPPPPPAATGGNAVIFIDYVVQPDDTLYRITEKQPTSIELMAVHGISAENIVPGATLRLPVANAAVCSGGRTYVVRPGDTVFSISRAYNTTTQAIASANGLAADFRIDVAQVLCIP